MERAPIIRYRTFYDSPLQPKVKPSNSTTPKKPSLEPENLLGWLSTVLSKQGKAKVAVECFMTHCLWKVVREREGGGVAESSARSRRFFATALPHKKQAMYWLVMRRWLFSTPMSSFETSQKLGTVNRQSLIWIHHLHVVRGSYSGRAAKSSITGIRLLWRGQPANLTTTS